jgi:F1F0 ATPase subunit 2
MMMNLVPLGLSFGIGIGLGWAYFLTLWMTLQRLSSTRQPALMMWGSLTLRLVTVLTVFYAMMVNGWKYFLLSFLGFLIMRTLLIRRWGLTTASLAHIRQ